VEQNTNQPNQKLKHKTPNHNAGNKSRKPLAVVIIVLAVALALIIGGYLGYKYYKSRQDTASKNTEASKTVQNVCTSLTTEIVPLLSSSQTAKLEPYIAKIKALPEYKSDPSCLIPIIVYAVNTSNVTEATYNLRLLESLDTSQYKIDPTFNSTGIIEIKDLKVLVEGVTIRKEENKANIIYF
jgi:hypothetical protein